MCNLNIACPVLRSPGSGSCSCTLRNRSGGTAQEGALTELATRLCHESWKAPAQRLFSVKFLEDLTYLNPLECQISSPLRLRAQNPWTLPEPRPQTLAGMLSSGAWMPKGKRAGAIQVAIRRHSSHNQNQCSYDAPTVFVDFVLGSVIFSMCRYEFQYTGKMPQCRSEHPCNHALMGPPGRQSGFRLAYGLKILHQGICVSSHNPPKERMDEILNSAGLFFGVFDVH